MAGKVLRPIVTHGLKRIIISAQAQKIKNKKERKVMGMICPECYRERFNMVYTLVPDESPGLCDKHVISGLEDELFRAYSKAKGTAYSNYELEALARSFPMAEQISRSRIK